MPALEVANANPEEPGPINPVVGIIYPPPEVRSILCQKMQTVTGFWNVWKKSVQKMFS
jgi:hypothetical protein